MPAKQPRERLQRYGVDQLSTAELVAIILTTGSQRRTVTELAADIIDDYGLTWIQSAEVQQLTEIDGIGICKASRLKASLALAHRDRYSQIDTVKSLEEAKELFIKRLRGNEQEELHGAFVDSANRLQRVQRFFKGSLRGITVEKRDIVRKALQLNTSAVILAHNHPGGDAQPTEADILTTHQIQAGLNEFDIDLLDHLIVGEQATTSLRKQDQLAPQG